MNSSSSQHHRNFYLQQTALQYTYDETTINLKNDNYENKTSFSRSLDFLDLHGVNSSNHARSIFLDHMKRALERNINIVTVVTGRGLHAEPGNPVGVLAKALPKWINCDEILLKQVKHCTMKSLGGCYKLILRISDNLPWLSMEEYYRKRAAARTKMPFYKGSSNSRYQHSRYKHIDNMKPDSVFSGFITCNDRTWLREGGKIALARCLDSQPQRTSCSLSKGASERGNFRMSDNWNIPPIILKKETNPDQLPTFTVMVFIEPKTGSISLKFGKNCETEVATPLDSRVPKKENSTVARNFKPPIKSSTLQQEKNGCLKYSTVVKNGKQPKKIYNQLSYLQQANKVASQKDTIAAKSGKSSTNISNQQSSLQSAKKVASQKDTIAAVKNDKALSSKRNEKASSKKSIPIPSYRVVQKEGPDHAPIFTVEVLVEGKIAYGKGPSIKKAQTQSLSNLKRNGRVN